MEKKNKVLVVLVIVLSILVVGLGSYIIYDKVLRNNDVQVDETNNNNNDETNIEYNSLISKISDVFDFVYDYYDTANAYCGKKGTEHITTSKTPSNGFYVSAEFNSYNDMIEYLKKYMSEEVIFNKNSMKEEFYVEQDGKLYCEDLGKGGNLYGIENTIFQINNINKDTINTTVAVQLSTGENITDKKYKDYINYEVIFSKNNDSWIITSYKRQD